MLHLCFPLQQAATGKKPASEGATEAVWLQDRAEETLGQGAFLNTTPRQLPSALPLPLLLPHPRAQVYLCFWSVGEHVCRLNSFLSGTVPTGTSVRMMTSWKKGMNVQEGLFIFSSLPPPLPPPPPCCGWHPARLYGRAMPAASQLLVF